MSEPTPVSRLDLELYALGKLPPDRAAALEALSDQDPALAQRLARVRVEVNEAAHELPTLQLPVEEPARAPWWRWAPLVLAGGLAVGLIAVNLPEPDVDPTPGVTFRGAMDLQLLRLRQGQAEEQGALVEGQPGDRLQFTLTPSERGWLAAYNVQDDGAVQTYLAPREVGAQVPVEGAVLLDDYAGSERIFFLHSAEPIPQARVEQACNDAFRQPLAELDTLPGLDATQRSVLVVKR